MDYLVSPAQMAASAALGAFIGYSTNFLAIRSLFRPFEPKWYTLGWQGVIPKNRARLADNVARVVGEELLYREYLVAQIERPALQESLRQVLAARLARLLDETPAVALADWLPADRIEPLVDRGMRLLAMWSRDEASAEFRAGLLDALEQRLGALVLGEVVDEASAEGLADLLDEVLVRDDTQADLAQALERQLLDFFARDAPLAEIVPDELRAALRQGLRREIPALLDRLATWLSSEDHAGELSARIFAALEALVESEDGLRGLVGEWGLRLFGARLETAVGARLPEVARDYLSSAETRASVERHLAAGVDALLDKPLGQLLGAERERLAVRIGGVATAWLTSARTRSQVRALVVDQYRRRRDQTLADLVPAALWTDMRRHLAELMRLDDEQVAAWGIGGWVRARLARGDRPLRQWLALGTDDEAALVAWTQQRATELLRREVPVLIDELDIAHMVREQIMGFDLKRVEYMVRSLIADQLRYIELLGAVLGGLVGLSLPFLNRLL